jgi:hypothetical protein
MQVYLVYVDSDTTEGKGRMVLVDAWADKEHAKNWVQSQPDPWNRTDRVFVERPSGTLVFGHMEIRTMDVITEDIADLEHRRAELREATLASLTSEQKWALGLEDDTKPT